MTSEAMGRKRATVAVSGLHRGESPQPGCAVISALRRAWPDLEILGLAYDPLESGLFSTGADRVDGAFVMPYPGQGPEALLARLDDIHARCRIDAIIPCLDSELPNYIELRSQLAARGIRTKLPAASSLERLSKASLPELCRELGIRTPRTVSAHEAAALAAQAVEIGYPCFVKGRLYGATLVQTVSELYAAFDRLFSLWGSPVLLQERLVGEEFDVAGIGDGQGGLIVSCAIRKLLRTNLGKAFGGVVVENPLLTECVARVVRQTKWEGPFEAEFIVPTNGEPCLLEFNPRFPAWIGFPAAVGCNMPAITLAAILGWEAPHLVTVPAGRMFLRHSTDLIADISDIACLLDGELPSRNHRDADPHAETPIRLVS